MRKWTHRRPQPSYAESSQHPFKIFMKANTVRYDIQDRGYVGTEMSQHGKDARCVIASFISIVTSLQAGCMKKIFKSLFCLLQCNHSMVSLFLSSPSLSFTLSFPSLSCSPSHISTTQYSSFPRSPPSPRSPKGPYFHPLPIGRYVGVSFYTLTRKNCFAPR